MQDRSSDDEINTFRIMLARRLDWSKAKAIEEGLKLQSMHGTDRAAAFLKSEQVDLDIALRVLAHPLERRHYKFQ